MEIKITQDSKSGIEAKVFGKFDNYLTTAAPHTTSIRAKFNDKVEKYSDSHTYSQDYFEIVDMFSAFF